ncbi:MAG: inorganic phosphate transporter [Methanocalculus sp.]|uniref:inorganic phosphate transporter n=1 Tax=Methanocalculus sp. TaxID=2004547 RepID=UPI00271F04C0|nr:inorganic phosphate transporter [Methanocalculus sp.]MDO8841034.1 inorganic phosphate transporter [Methanocalculus sp.]MDO9540205.1 inorganic phosphate transporter [Methanocalculus sp.]
MELLIIAGIILALLFNFVNGLNDAANSIATVIATKVLTPLQAVGLAAFFNMVGPLLFTTAIAKTIGKGIVDPSVLTPFILVTGLVGSVFWVFFCSHFGVPVSSSHSLIGGLIGAGIGAAGFYAVVWPTWETIALFIELGLMGAVVGAVLFGTFACFCGDKKPIYFGLGAMIGFAITIPLMMLLGVIEIKGILAVIIFIVISPTLGFISAYAFAALIMRYLSHASTPRRMNYYFRKLQIVSASFHAIGHGSNDAQNAMGIITAILVAGGLLTEFEVPLWVIITSCGAISLGTLLGGWKVIDKLANRITRITPYQGFSASTSGGLVLSAMTILGIPVSTTHAMSGAIMGVGTTQGSAAVRWGVVREIIIAWIITIPAAAIVSYIFFSLASLVP